MRSRIRRLTSRNAPLVTMFSGRVQAGEPCFSKHPLVDGRKRIKGQKLKEVRRRILEADFERVVVECTDANFAEIEQHLPARVRRREGGLFLRRPPENGVRCRQS